jgi:hypothetical protein
MSLKKKEEGRPLKKSLERREEKMWTMFWGADMHRLLMQIACEYPVEPHPEEEEDMKNMIYLLFRFLCCKHCRMHAHYYLRMHPVATHSRNALLDWQVAFHNHLNKRLGKRSDWTTQEALNAFAEDLNRQKDGLERAKRMRLEDEQKIRELQAEIAKLQSQLSLQTKPLGFSPLEFSEEKECHVPEISIQHECLGAWSDAIVEEENKEMKRLVLFTLGFISLLLFVSLGLLVSAWRFRSTNVVSV